MKMNSGYVERMMWHFRYYAHTQNCYHSESLHHCYNITDRLERNRAVKAEIERLVGNGEMNLLPYRITILQGDTMASVESKGRARIKMAGQLKGTFTKPEDSPYKAYKPYNIQTGLWPVEGHKDYYVGSIGITGLNGRITQDNSDMIVIHTANWRCLEVFVFRGLAGTQKQLDYLPEVMEYLESIDTD